jgi:hypothetical protein
LKKEKTFFLLSVFSIALIAQDCDCFGSGDFLPPSPPAEKATARQDQAGEGQHRRWERERSANATTVPKAKAC